MHWWVFVPRIDQYWGMFAPNPGNVDFWLVLDSELIVKDTSLRIKRDIWKDYALEDSSDHRVSFAKPENLHEISSADRWRKYVYNLLGNYYNNDSYKRYFAESWCRRYNTEESPYILDKFIIYSMSQNILPNYARSPIKKESIWHHCCLKDGCFETETTPENPQK